MKRRRRRWALTGRSTVVRLRAGDVIAVTVPHAQTVGEREALRCELEEVFGYQRTIVILAGGASLEVLRDPEVAGGRR